MRARSHPNRPPIHRARLPSAEQSETGYFDGNMNQWIEREYARSGFGHYSLQLGQVEFIVRLPIRARAA